MSQRNTDEVSEAHWPAGDVVAGSVGFTSSPPVCSLSSPLQAAGAAQRDVREHALCEVEFESTHCHATGFEELKAVAVPPIGVSGALSPIQLETRGTTSQKTKAFQRELWCRQTIHKNTVAAKLKEIGELKLADGLELCHTETTWCICKQCATSKPFLNRCERFYCPECQPTLSKDRERSVGWWAREMRQPKHVVLTLVNADELTKDYVKWAKDCFSKLRRRRFAKNWVGGFYNWEVTKEVAGSVKRGHVMAGGWHLHLHALVESKWIDVDQLSSEWQKVTGGKGRIVHVADARRVDYLKEVTKYAVKGNQLAAWTGAEILMFINAFTGVRTFGVFGELYGKRTEFKEWLAQLQQNSMKCKCGCTEFWYQSDWEYETSGGTLVSEGPTRGPTPLFAQLAFSTLVG